VWAQNITNVQPGADNNKVTARNEVSIVEGSSDMGDKAYRPSPIKIKVGDSITWTNDDSIAPHTVTEGNPASSVPTGGFDSGLLSQGQTFKHRFDKAAVTEYFCTLHPTMIGKVAVNS
jgi:nitrite reductase (NO-forming)